MIDTKKPLFFCETTVFYFVKNKAIKLFSL